MHSALTSSASCANAVTPYSVWSPISGYDDRLVNGTTSVILLTFHVMVGTSNQVTLPLKVSDRL